MHLQTLTLRVEIKGYEMKGREKAFSKAEGKQRLELGTLEKYPSLGAFKSEFEKHSQIIRYRSRATGNTYVDKVEQAKAQRVC